MAFLGALRGTLGNGRSASRCFAVVSLATTLALWWFTAWFLLLGEVRARVLVPTGVITGVAMAVFAVSATVWMPDVVTRNEGQFGFFGVALALVTWFSGAAICILVGACAGRCSPRTRDRSGTFVRGRRSSTLTTAPARPSRPPRASSPSATPSPRTRSPEPVCRPAFTQDA